ncbi:hypothetical protein B0H15DRAFT_994087 [Mycena belliarum]|uniref:Uncharacterized protein n=1 Tax=Mycena belliarum TaxID=1033014 RepID=A0AAD6TY26_9AGAR|nr:hypothetical protein B0H15DRAFT_994087 [Mycena belliae]
MKKGSPRSASLVSSHGELRRPRLGETGERHEEGVATVSLPCVQPRNTNIRQVEDDVNARAACTERTRVLDDLFALGVAKEQKMCHVWVGATNLDVLEEKLERDKPDCLLKHGGIRIRVASKEGPAQDGKGMLVYAASACAYCKISVLMDNSNQQRAVELMQEWKEHVEEDVLDLQDTQRDSEDVPDCAGKAWLLVHESLLEACEAFHKVHQDTGLERRARQESLDDLIAGVDEQRDNGTALELGIIRTDERLQVETSSRTLDEAKAKIVRLPAIGGP